MIQRLVLSVVCCAAAAHAGPRDLMTDAWPASDGLGRPLPLEPRPPRGDRFVGIFYFLWLDAPPGTPVHDMSAVLAGQRKWGPEHAFHWWTRPRFGYYSSRDEWVIRRHAAMLTAAGIDVIVCDVTNALTYDETYLKILDVFARVRAEGGRTPQLAFITHANSPATVQKLWETLYSKGLHKDLWFTWRGKPLLMASPEGLSAEQKAFFTLRESWAWTDPKRWFGDGKDKWPWLDNWPQNFGWHDDKSSPEQISVSVAQHPTGNIGRSHLDNKQPNADKTESAKGLYFHQQIERALKVDPEFVFVTGWNEWVAQRFVVGPDGKGPTMLGKPLKPGDSFFVDAYSEEFSRDIEPMLGGHGDNYYYQMCAFVRQYKGARPVPKASAKKTVALANEFTQWDGVTPVYLDDLFDTAPRDAAGFGQANRYVNRTGRNDIDRCLVARDSDLVYFYLSTREPPRPAAGETPGPVLLIDTDQNATTGWHGYDLVVGRAMNSPTKLSVEKNVDGKWAWQAVGVARAAAAGRELHCAVPRRWLGTPAGGRSLAFDFKWTDHVLPAPSDDRAIDPIDFLDTGDVAPAGRMNFRFTE